MTVKKNTPSGRDRGSKAALPAYVGRASLRCPGIHTVQGQLFIFVQYVAGWGCFVVQPIQQSRPCQHLGLTAGPSAPIM